MDFCSNPDKRFSGTWEDRLGSLFDVGVEYEGKSVLDLGCNMGIVAYELSKRRPSFIHGVELYEPHVFVAKSIFSGSDVPNRFDCISIGTPTFYDLLLPRYDIVMMLAIYHHLRKVLKPEEAVRLLNDLARRTNTIVVRGPERSINEIFESLQRLGFRVSDTAARRNIGGLTVFRR